MKRVGRYTAVFILISVGGLLLLDQLLSAHTLRTAINWWPALFIILGLEYLMMSRKVQEEPLKLDLMSLLFSVIISAVVVGSVQAATFSKSMFSEMSSLFNNFSFSDSDGMKFEQPLVSIPYSADTERLELTNLNGDVTFVAGTGESLEIQSTVLVSGLDANEAQRVADESIIEHNGDSTLSITTRAKEYKAAIFGNRIPRMNLVIALPAAHKVEIDLQLRKGKVEADAIPVSKFIHIHTTNGMLHLASIEGDVDAESTNGKINIADIKGNVTVKTTNGLIGLERVSGSADAKTTNGLVDVKDIDGDATVRTTNGVVNIENVNGALAARTTNGTVTANSQMVKGDWDLHTTNGKISVKIPADSDVSVDGSANGGIHTDLPLNVENKQISGKIGSGTYTMQMETSHGGLEINKLP